MAPNTFVLESFDQADDAPDMKQIKRRGVAVVTGAALWGMFGASLAMGLGKPNSHAILGEELTLTVPVRLDAGERLDDECVAADVFFGDDKLVSSQVRTRVSTDAQGASTLVVSTRRPVSEPVVTVYVVAGCQSRITRKIVALADPPGLQLPGGAPVGTVAEAMPVPAVSADVRAPAPSRSPSQRTGLADASARAPAAVAAAIAGDGAAPARKNAGTPRTSAAAPAATGTGTADGALGWRERMKQARQARIADGEVPVGAAPARARSAAAVAERKPPAEVVSRLELDPVSADAMVAPQLKMGANLATVPDPDTASPDLLARRASASAYWRALQATPEQLARDQERLQQLELRVAELQAQQAVLLGSGASEASSGLVAAAHVPAAATAASSAESKSGSRVVAVLALGAALGLALLYVLWRSSANRSKSGPDWWQGQSGETESPELPDITPRGHQVDPRDVHPTTVEFVHVPHETHEAMAAQPAHGSQAGRAPTAPSMLSAVDVPLPPLSPVSPVSGSVLPFPGPKLPAGVADAFAPSARAPGARFTSMFGSLPQQGDDSLRAVAVEELIDLEQQAEFFVVLGQDDAAIDLLENYVQHNPQGSPLPMLKLLDIHRRLGRRQDYERVCALFDGRFNAHAPSWLDDMNDGLSLADYPEVVSRLQALWPEPAQAMAVLEKSLLRPTAGGDTFDLPAYRELLTLYAVARDLAEGAAAAERVDVLLPLTGADVASVTTPVASGDADVSPLMATRPIKAQPSLALARGVAVDLEVDFQLDDEPRRV